MAINYCDHCGAKLAHNAEFCSNCAKPIDRQSLDKTIASINQSITLENTQDVIVRRSLYTALFFALLTVLPAMIVGGADWVFALGMVGILGFFSSLGTAWMFHSRSKKLQSLIDGSNLLAHWKLTSEEKENYIAHLFEAQKAKNRAIFTIIFVMFILIFGIFIALIEEDAKLPMFIAMVGFIAFLSLFALGTPYYYRHTNRKGDGEILIGAKFAYVNGYFHNWDFPLSGLEKVKIIQEPFYGIDLVYYYTDRTLRNSYAMQIPANKEMNLEEVIEKMLKANPEVKKKK